MSDEEQEQLEDDESKERICRGEKRVGGDLVKEKRGEYALFLNTGKTKVGEPGFLLNQLATQFRPPQATFVFLPRLLLKLKTP